MDKPLPIKERLDRTMLQLEAIITEFITSVIEAYSPDFFVIKFVIIVVEMK